MAERRVALVTGASRGAGKGVALGLAMRGYTVYVTGRSQQEGDAALPGTIHRTASEIDAAGGHGVAIACDHSRDEQVAAVFDQIQRETGRLDILFNNVAFIHDELVTPAGFWEKSPDISRILDVGLRSAFIASWHAAQLMVPAGRGLIAMGSSFGAACYMHGPAYGAQKAGLDKMAWDMAIDLNAYGVAAVSVWLGPLLTERTERVFAEHAEQYAGFAELAEHPQFTGLLLDRLYEDPTLMDRSGQTLIGAELGREYGLRDLNGREPPSWRESLGNPLVFTRAIVR
ncbi:MAG: SDR family NAD(P)-dependent oxidoreductase [Gammaproteobacteria bacterium]